MVVLDKTVEKYYSKSVIMETFHFLLETSSGGLTGHVTAAYYPAGTMDGVESYE